MPTKQEKQANSKFMSETIQNIVKMILAKFFGKKKNKKWVFNRSVNYVYIADIIEFFR